MLKLREFENREKIKDAQPILEQMNETKRQKLQEKEHLLIQKEREEQCRVERSRELESLEKEIVPLLSMNCF